VLDEDNYNGPILCFYGPFFRAVETEAWVKTMPNFCKTMAQ